MYSKILLVIATIAVAAAQYHKSHGHGHGHAVSSQSIVVHHSHGHAEQAPVIAHHAPAIAHAPVVTHHAPAVAHATVIAHHEPVVAHAPVIAHAPVVHHQPTHHASHGHEDDSHAPAHYSFEYSVNDPHTGDIKSQKETRKGHAVQGSYSLHEADGTVRHVDYTSDAHSGFNAVVHRKGHATHAVPVHQPSHHSSH